MSDLTTGHPLLTCRHALGAQWVPGVKAEPLDHFRNFPTSDERASTCAHLTVCTRLYCAPALEQERNAIHRVVARALRILRELPYCDVTGLPVDVVGVVKDDRAVAVYRCSHCYGAK